MRPSERIAILGVYGALLGSALALGSAGGWPLAAAHLVVVVAVGAWAFGALRGRRLEWRRTPLDLPVALLVAFVVAQVLLGNHVLASWALGAPAAPAAERFPSPVLTLGSVSPGQTARTLLLFLVYAAVFRLVVDLFDRRDRLVALVRTLVTFGGILAFAALLDYMAGGPSLLWWRELPLGGRLAGTFDNPDHFAAWLTMLALLGLGWVAARHLEGGGAPSPRLFFTSSSARERLLRRYAPLFAVAVMLVALVFTLSRGALASLVLALLLFVALVGAQGRRRWTPLLLLLVVVAGHAAWIGLEPLVARLPTTPGDFTRRWVQWQSTVPMLADFPLLGVGLGAYRDVYFRYQPLALQPGTVYYPYAHSDLLQLVVELGTLGALVVAVLGWRLARHLARVRLPGEPRAGALALGIGAGATSAFAALVLHSAVDFPARIPANGLLGAACLGIAFVAIGGWTGAGRQVRVIDWRGGWGRMLRPVIVVGAGGLLVLAAATVVRDAVVAEVVRSAVGPARAAALDRALALDGARTRVLTERAGMQLDAAAQMWRWGVAPDGTPFPSLDAQRQAAGGLVERAVTDLRRVLLRTPTDPFVHERLAWAHALGSLVQAERGAAQRATALAHLERAILLAPDNPFLYRSRVVLGLTAPDTLLPDALRAAREAVRREPRLLPELVERLRVVGLRLEQWRSIAGPSAVEQLELGAILEARRLGTEARQIYAGALAVAAAHDRPLLVWRLSSLLVAQGEATEALRQLDALGADAPDHPELHLVRARALALRDAPEALDAYQRAVAAATRRGDGTETDPLLVVDATSRERLAALGLDLAPRLEPARYRRALAQYLLERGEWEAALREWSSVSQALPRDADAHYARGLALERLARPGPALEAFQRAVAADGRQARFRLALAERLWQADRYHEAAAEWRRARDLEPADAQIRLVLARVYLRLGQPDAARREFGEATRFAPDHPDVRRGFAALGPLSTSGP